MLGDGAGDGLRRRRGGSEEKKRQEQKLGGGGEDKGRRDGVAAEPSPSTRRTPKAVPTTGASEHIPVRGCSLRGYDTNAVAAASDAFLLSSHFWWGCRGGGAVAKGPSMAGEW